MEYEPMKPKTWAGLGDAIEAVTTVTGIKAATEAVAKVTGKDCGCGKRKEKLNNKFPFNPAQTDDPEADAQS